MLEECGKVMRQGGIKIVRELGWMGTCEYVGEAKATFEKLMGTRKREESDKTVLFKEERDRFRNFIHNPGWSRSREMSVVFQKPFSNFSFRT